MPISKTEDLVGLGLEASSHMEPTDPRHGTKKLGRVVKIADIEVFGVHVIPLIPLG